MDENMKNTGTPGAEAPVHKRRVRYSGTHPKSYKEKYKEHDPEKYKDTIEKVIQKGSTPAGMHISIMVQEILDFLQIKPGMTGLDATLGYGGHTKAMLQKLEDQGHIYALDVDPIESAKTKERLASQGFGEEILTVRLQNFADIDQVTKDTGKKFDFILYLEEIHDKASGAPVCKKLSEFRFHSGAYRHRFSGRNRGHLLQCTSVCHEAAGGPSGRFRVHYG